MCRQNCIAKYMRRPATNQRAYAHCWILVMALWGSSTVLAEAFACAFGGFRPGRFLRVATIGGNLSFSRHWDFLQKEIMIHSTSSGQVYDLWLTTENSRLTIDDWQASSIQHRVSRITFQKRYNPTLCPIFCILLFYSYVIYVLYDIITYMLSENIKNGQQNLTGVNTV